MIRSKRVIEEVEVKQIQKFLNTRLQPSPNLRIDGIYGQKTAKAVRLFQAVYGLGVDGVVGPLTRRALESGGVSNQIKPIPAFSIIGVPWMDIAKKEIGQREVKGKANNPRIIKYHTATTLKASSDETPWCSSFVNWVFRQVNIVGTNSAAAASWAHWGTSATAKYGAVAVIFNSKAANSSLSASGNHVGFLVQATSTHFLILGGNQSDQVKISSFPKSAWALRAYRWPK